MNTSCRTMRKELSLFMRVIRQERTDTNKIYSLHEPVSHLFSILLFQ